MKTLIPSLLIDLHANTTLHDATSDCSLKVRKTTSPPNFPHLAFPFPLPYLQIRQAPP